jgi:hypothetical protein
MWHRRRRVGHVICDLLDAEKTWGLCSIPRKGVDRIRLRLAGFRQAGLKFRDWIGLKNFVD